MNQEANPQKTKRTQIESHHDGKYKTKPILLWTLSSRLCSIYKTNPIPRIFSPKTENAQKTKPIFSQDSRLVIIVFLQNKAKFLHFYTKNKVRQENKPIFVAQSDLSLQNKLTRRVIPDSDPVPKATMLDYQNTKQSQNIFSVASETSAANIVKQTHFHLTCGDVSSILPCTGINDILNPDYRSPL
jgi:hypothetical protein